MSEQFIGTEVPYHTPETLKIAEERAKAEDKPAEENKHEAEDLGK